MLGQIRQQIRRDRLPGHALAFHRRQGLGQHPVVQGAVQLVLGRHRIGDDQGRVVAAERVLAAHHRGHLPRVPHRPVNRLARVRQIEPGESVGPEAQDADAQRLQPLQRRRHVQDRLHARAHHGDPGAGQQREVGGLVLHVRPAAVHPAQAPGAEHPDPRPGRKEGGTRHGRRPAHPRGHRRSQVPEAELAHVRVGGDPLDLPFGQPHPGHPVDHRDGRRYGPGFPDDGLQLAGHQQVARPRQPVRDDRRLQRDHRLPPPERIPDLGRGHHLTMSVHPLYLALRTTAQTSCGRAMERPCRSACPWSLA
ncbi:hypothetical protein SBRY_60062 [Actinacidiphila bryophytorum]|uniref:Uncharacterized protein n=1 Tax=Actinacidiphila bryophytorum TaxID=1436133 RepID=A0A9W4H5P2_9ACTN|nr:hypothetical protein SBRY_60062 [Actinacidiphila bryophytorum]